ncbi:MAG TPA: hypothetical protein VES41_20945 [Variovorax sp.]|nr:hypothetical protein [Variovorax sp.]HYP85840.1 hypothetical protein [Variovorax sp.]
MRIRARPDIGQLKKQAKELLALYRRGDPAAMQRFRAPLPAARGRNDEELAGRSLRLHDAQSCIAREYGFPSWADLQVFVLARPALADDPEQAVRHWVRMVYAGDVAGGNDTHRPAVAARMLAESPTLAGDDDSYLACAIGNEQVLRRATARDPAWVHREGGPLNLPPLVAVTHSGLATRPGFRERLRDCARFLLSAGASANQSVGNRWPPASLEVPSQTERLSALYGAAGKAFDPQLTRLLLEAGADPNDGESLYHSLEAPACTRLLLEAGARIAGSNAMYRALDLEDPGVLELLLAHGGDANEPALGPPRTRAWRRLGRVRRGLARPRPTTGCATGPGRCGRRADRRQALSVRGRCRRGSARILGRACALSRSRLAGTLRVTRPAGNPSRAAPGAAPR